MKKIVRVTESDLTRIVKRVMNESDEVSNEDDKRSKFLDKVITMFVEQTKMVGTIKGSIYPYYRKIYRTPFSPMNQFLSDFDYFEFYNYCKKMFNLKNEEIYYVWRKYKNILSNKK
jgi:hypothetical protein